VRVGQHLHLDVPGPGEVALHVALGATEVGERLARRRRRLAGVSRAEDHFIPRPRRRSGLDRERPPELVAERDDLVGASSGTDRPGTADTPAARRPSRDEILSPMTSMADAAAR